VRFVVLLTIASALHAQVPPPEKLSESDSRQFQAEVDRVKGLLATAGDKCTVQYALARTLAYGGQYRQALDALRDAVDLNVGLDPSRDDIFARLRGTNEFSLLMRSVRDGTPPVSNSKPAFTVSDAQLVPEGIAWDGRRKRLFLGSMWEHKIIECTSAGDCHDLVRSGQDGLYEVLGIKGDTRDRTIWVAGNSVGESGIFHFDTPQGTLIQKYTVNRVGEPHYFNDMAISSKGDVFATDTQAGTVYRIGADKQRLEIFDPGLKLQGANGIAISDDDKTLYVAGFPDGIRVVDIASKTSRAIGHPPDLCLGNIDGLLYYKGSLVAIQNGVMTPRVARYKLTPDGRDIASFEVLERRNPAFDGITTGAIADGVFYYMANPQTDKVAEGRLKPNAQLNPVQVLRLELQP
jgi:sugar lactone lactonase YvrE